MSGRVRRGSRRILSGATVVGAVLASALVGATAGPASAAEPDEGVAIVHLERSDVGFEVSVDVPAGVDLDLSGVTATVNGTGYDASAARIADGDSRVQRTAILAIDTSDSMKGPRFDAAQ